MNYLIGVLVAVGVVLFARVVGFDRDRAFYPTVLIVVGTYYILFGAMQPSQYVLGAEIIGCTVFIVAAIGGFKWDMRYAAAGLIGHGLFDLVHHRLIANTGVPVWWPGFCMACDVVLGGWLLIAWRQTLDVRR